MIKSGRGGLGARLHHAGLPVEFYLIAVELQNSSEIQFAGLESITCNLEVPHYHSFIVTLTSREIERIIV